MDLLLLAARQNIGEDRDTVHGGFYVCHQDDAGISAFCGGQGPCVQIFLIREAGIPEMRVRVHKTRGCAETLCVQNLQVLCVRRG